MKTQTTAPMHADRSAFPPSLARALRTAIQADKLGNVLLSAGATKFRGTPTEVLEELAAAQTAAWIVGNKSNPMSGPFPPVPEAEIFEAAADSIDPEALTAAAEIVGVRGSNEVENIRKYLTATIASTAFEAARFAHAEDRPVCHNCVAVGGTSVARLAWQPGVAEGQRVGGSR